MNIRLRKRTALVAGIALVAGTAATAVADGPWSGDPASLAWNTAANAAVADPDAAGGSLKFYDAAGTEITSGSASTKPFAAYVSATGAVAGSYATLFAYEANASAAAGSWSGSQVSGTYADPADAPGSIDDSKLVFAGGAGDSALNDLSSIFGAADGIYQVRLRGSSSSGGVGTTYASAFLQVANGTWSVTTWPIDTGGTTTGGGTTSGTTTPPAPTWAVAKTTFTGAKKGVIASKSESAAAKILKLKTTYKNNAKIKGLKIKAVKYNIYEGKKVVGTWKITAHGDIQITKIKLKKTKKAHTLKFQIDFQKAKGKSGAKAKKFAKTKYVAVKKFKTKKY